MAYLKDLNFEDLIELLDYLEDISGKEIKEEKLSFVEAKIGNFFPSLSAVQEMEFSSIIGDRSIELFELFKGKYPNLEIDTTGRSTPKEKEYWEIREKALNELYLFALENLEKNSFLDKSTNKMNMQVYNAKNIVFLKDMNGGRTDLYAFYRKLFLDKFKGHRIINQRNFSNAEVVLGELFSKDEVQLFFLNTVIYCKDKDENEISLFLEHLFERLEILLLDKKLSSDSNKAFLEGINDILSKNN